MEWDQESESQCHLSHTVISDEYLAGWWCLTVVKPVCRTVSTIILNIHTYLQVVNIGLVLLLSLIKLSRDKGVSGIRYHHDRKPSIWPYDRVVSYEHDLALPAISKPIKTWQASWDFANFVSSSQLGFYCSTRYGRCYSMFQSGTQRFVTLCDAVLPATYH